jgi:hypothetical protein
MVPHSQCPVAEASSSGASIACSRQQLHPCWTPKRPRLQTAFVPRRTAIVSSASKIEDQANNAVYPGKVRPVASTSASAGASDVDVLRRELQEIQHQVTTQTRLVQQQQNEIQSLQQQLVDASGAPMSSYDDMAGPPLSLPEGDRRQSGLYDARYHSTSS